MTRREHCEKSKDRVHHNTYNVPRIRRNVTRKSSPKENLQGRNLKAMEHANSLSQELDFNTQNGESTVLGKTRHDPQDLHLPSKSSTHATPASTTQNSQNLTRNSVRIRNVYSHYAVLPKILHIIPLKLGMSTPITRFCPQLARNSVKIGNVYSRYTVLPTTRT